MFQPLEITVLSSRWFQISNLLQPYIEGGDTQHIRFATSVDDGDTWSDAKCVVWGLTALW